MRAIVSPFMLHAILYMPELAPVMPDPHFHFLLTKCKTFPLKFFPFYTDVRGKRKRGRRNILRINNPCKCEGDKGEEYFFQNDWHLHFRPLTRLGCQGLKRINQG